MKCQDFETSIYSLAREHLIEASARLQTLAHIEQCARCANAFAEQRAVASRVRAVALSLADEAASPHVEAALRHAFREQSAQSNTAAIGSLPARQFWRRLGLRPVLVAAAAAVIVLAFLMSIKWLKSPVADPQVGISNPPSAPSAPAPDGKKEPLVLNQEKNVPEQKLVERPKRRPAVRLDPEPETKVATRFYPLFEEGELVPLESGKIIRVEVPASTLIALGLPITAENSDRPLQADLLLGQDGLARAIRFLPEPRKGRRSQ